MARDQREVFSQDRLGNVNREFDDIRGIDGMSEEEDHNGHPKGLVDVGGLGHEEPVICMAIPEDSNGFHLEEAHLYNGDAADGTFKLHQVTLDEDGVVTGVYARSTMITVSEGVTRTISYSGKEFEGDAIAVTADVEGEAAVGGYVDHKESDEPATEMRHSP